MHVIRVVLDPTGNIAWHVNSETVTDTTAMQHPTKNALRKTSSKIVLKVQVRHGRLERISAQNQQTDRVFL